MSLFFFKAKMITKSKQSAVASASYRSGQDLYSERDQEMKSYRTREVKPDSFILAPNHAPDWVYDREKLWNEVEKVENRWNSQLAREVLLALPIELNDNIQKELLQEYVQENFVDNGMVADVSIHRDKKDNPHAHIMLTVRPFNEDGSWGNKKKREYIFDENGEHILDKNGKKKFNTIDLTNWNEKETLIKWRKNFAEKVNEYYLKHGINESISHESYEAQGLNKLPRHRLKREEYWVEKKAKQEALKNGTEYQPITTYGKLNKEIESSNSLLEKISKRIELLKQKVISLSDYRETKNDDLIDQLNQIRKGIDLSPDEWESMKIVVNRVTGFVDLDKAKDNLYTLDNWKKKLDYQKGLLESEKIVLAKIQYAFDTEPNKTLLYGIIPNKFEEQFAEKVNLYNQNKDKHEQALKEFDDLYEHSNRVYEIQKMFTEEEFSFLYPEYQNKILENEKLLENEKILEVKAKYVKLFREEGIKRKSIPEFENDLRKFDPSYIKIESLLNEWKKVNKSLVVLERMKEKFKAEYRDSYKNFDSEKTYNASIKYTDARRQVSLKEELKDQLKAQLLECMLERYPDVSEDVITQIPSSIQSRLLELHLDDEQTGKLTDDLEIVKTQMKSNHENNKNNNFEFENTSNITNDTGALFDMLINLSARQENNEHESDEKNKKKKKPRMLYREIERDM